MPSYRQVPGTNNLLTSSLMDNLPMAINSNQCTISSNHQQVIIKIGGLVQVVVFARVS